MKMIHDTIIIEIIIKARISHCQHPWISSLLMSSCRYLEMGRVRLLLVSIKRQCACNRWAILYCAALALLRNLRPGNEPWCLFVCTGQHYARFVVTNKLKWSSLQRRCKELIWHVLSSYLWTEDNNNPINISKLFLLFAMLSTSTFCNTIQHTTTLQNLSLAANLILPWLLVYYLQYVSLHYQLTLTSLFHSICTAARNSATNKFSTVSYFFSTKIVCNTGYRNKKPNER